MNFWILALTLLAIPAAFISWPLFAGSVRERIIAIVLLLIMPLGGLVFYQQIGTPAAIDMPVAQVQQHTEQQLQMDELVARLQQRMNENPDDVDGWLMLGRSLKTMNRYVEAETALTNANRLIPDNALVMVELAEARMLASGNPNISPRELQLVEAALQIDPQQQKGLWILGMAAAQAGDEARAITLWQSLLEQLDPESGAASTVSQQIELAQSRLGQATSGPQIPVTITIADDLAGTVPGNAILFVFIHPAGAKGMPLAVKRVAAENFPIVLQFSDSDLLTPGTSLSGFEELDISARISVQGTVAITSGDYQANVVKFNSNDTQEIALHISQRVP